MPFAHETQQRALPIVVVGHVDHGKSTLVGRLLHDTDSLPDGKLDQLRKISDKRRYVIIDAPGHKEFLRNMVTGASRAEAAVLVIDAKQGLSEQSRRHAYLLRLLGIEQVAVAVNKMDLVGHDKARFAAIAGEIRGYLAGLGLAAGAVIPVSARHGDNIA